MSPGPCAPNKNNHCMALHTSAAGFLLVHAVNPWSWALTSSGVLLAEVFRLHYRSQIMFQSSSCMGSNSTVHSSSNPCSDASHLQHACCTFYGCSRFQWLLSAQCMQSGTSAFSSAGHEHFLPLLRGHKAVCTILGRSVFVL